MGKDLKKNKSMYMHSWIALLHTCILTHPLLIIPSSTRSTRKEYLVLKDERLGIHLPREGTCLPQQDILREMSDEVPAEVP